MRVLHSAALLRPMAGIIKQMSWEADAAESRGLEWDVKLFCPAAVTIPENIKWSSESVSEFKQGKLKSWIAFRREYYKKLEQLSEHYDVLLIRYYVHDPFLLKFIRGCNKPVFLVHHSFEVAELAMPRTLSSVIRSNLERLIGPACIRAAYGVIGVTGEVAAHQVFRAMDRAKISMVYPNGVVMDDVCPVDCRKEEPELLFVAGDFVPWHGLDLLISSVLESAGKFTLHLVGQITDEQKAMIGEDSRIKVHGFLSYEEIRGLAERCWISLSSFALYRKGMSEACTLKVRESFLLGLPVYSGHKDVFPKDFKYFKNGPCSIDEILEYARLMKGYAKWDVKSTAKEYVDKGSLTAKLYQEIMAVI